MKLAFYSSILIVSLIASVTAAPQSRQQELIAFKECKIHCGQQHFYLQNGVCSCVKAIAANTNGNGKRRDS
ncbi:hypothetical protein BDB01DRAFT_790181 [Pilobolus umbonatus]|nr:hypothetical protein BDB01DRAFT_790181 [Pilobolus umbonatus]